MDTVYYFPHNCNMSDDPKIVVLVQRYGYEGYGWYNVILETLRKKQGYKIPLEKKYISYLQIKLHAEIEKLETFLKDCYDLGLFDTDGSDFWSNALITAMAPLDNRRKQGKISAAKRWGKNIPNEAPKKYLERFSPPSVDQVAEYARSINYNINPGAFVNFYESKGWMVGKNKMKDWKASVRYWRTKNEEKEQPRKINDVTDELKRQMSEM